MYLGLAVRIRTRARCRDVGNIRKEKSGFYTLCAMLKPWTTNEQCTRKGSKKGPFSRPVGFWNLKTKFKCCGRCHRSWNGFYTWNRRKNVYEKLMKTPSNSQFSPFRPIKCREKTLIYTKFLNSKVCFGGPRSYWNTTKITWFIKKPSRPLHFRRPPPPPP